MSNRLAFRPVPFRPGVIAALAFLLVVLTLLPAGAQTFPPLTGRVVDAANLLDPAAKARIEATLAAFEARSSDQLVVATVPDLQGFEIADYGYRLGRAWGIGQKGENNGAILLVSRNDRKVRIEVGYGLEGTLTDALSRVVIETDILPRFRAGDFSGGIEAGTGAILQILSGDAADVQARAERNRQDAGWQASGDDWLTTLVVLFILVTAVGPVILALLGRLFGRRPPSGSAAASRRRRRSAWGSGFGAGPGGGFGGGGGSWGGGSSGGGFSGGGGSFGGGGSSGSW